MAGRSATHPQSPSYGWNPSCVLRTTATSEQVLGLLVQTRASSSVGRGELVRRAERGRGGGDEQRARGAAASGWRKPLFSL
uniref:Uncharacterized protein n=1 Tax=Arundo donax TaxID=35708 RepID=A0A0A9UBK0_ARUDO